MPQSFASVIMLICISCFCVGQGKGVFEAQITSAPTVRHKECQLIVPLPAQVFGALLVSVIEPPS